MAIGKVNAYATVEAPKVDFGEIALNAQKIQQADLERMKDMIPKKEKNDFKINNIEGGFTKTGNGGYDQSMTNLVNKLTDRNLLINKEAESIGRYTPELAAEQQKIQNTLKGLDIVAKKFTEDATVFAKDSKEGKFSSIDKSRFDIFEDIAQKRNLEVEEDEDGDIIFKVRATDADGKFLLDSNGNPVYKKFNDRGVERDTISKYELENGSLFGNSIKELDRTKTIGEIQNNLKLRTSVVDANGTLTRTRTFLTDDDNGYIDNAVNGVLSNYDNLSSYLYSLDREKYSTPKTMEQYKQDGDIEIAKKAMKNGVLAGLGFENKEDRTKPAVTKIDLGGKGEEDAYLMADGITYEQRTGKDKKTYQTGITIPIYDNKIKFGYNGKKTQLNDVRFDYTKKQVNITLFVPSSESSRGEEGVSSSTGKGRLVTVSVAGPGTRADFGSKVAKYLGVGNDNNDLLNYVGSLIPEGDKKDYYNRHILKSKNTIKKTNSLIPPSQK